MTQNFPQVGVQAVVSGLSSFVAASNTVQNQLNAMNTAANRTATGSTSAWANLAKGVTFGTGSIVAAVGAVVGALGGTGIIAASAAFAARYESTMTKVQVLSKSTAADMSRLDDVIYKIGTTTNVSMNEAALGAAELAKAGLSVKNQIDGALKSVVDFTIASAGEVGMAEAAITVAKGMAVWARDGVTAERVTNALTGAAQGSVLSYRDLTRSFQQASNVGELLHVSVEDLSTTLAVFGQAGLRGSDAGTSLKQMFLELMGPSEKAEKLMKEYNISLYDATGKARPLRDVIAGLEEAFGEAAIATGNITEAQRNFALKTIFGSDAIRSAIVSANFGTKAWDEMRKTIDETKATDIANLFMKPTIQQLEILGNKLMAAGGTFGGVFLEGARNSIIAMSQFMDTISRKEIQDFGNIIIHNAARLMTAAGAAKDFAIQTFNAASQADTATPVMIGLATAISYVGAALVAPALRSGFIFFIGAASVVTRSAVVLATGARVLAVAFAAGGLSAVLVVVSAAALKTAMALVTLKLVLAPVIFLIGGLVTNFMGMRTTLILGAGMIDAKMQQLSYNFKASFSDMAAIVASTLSSILRNIVDFLNKLPGVSKVLTGSLGTLADNWAKSAGDFTASAQRIRAEGEKSAQSILDGAAAWDIWATETQDAAKVSLTFGGDLKGLVNNIFDVENALLSAENAMAGGRESTERYGGALGLYNDAASQAKGKTTALAEELERNFAANAAKAKAEADKLAAILGGKGGGTLPGGFNDTGSAADKAGKQVESFLQKLNVGVDAAKKFFTALGFSADQSTSALMSLGESALEATPEIADLNITAAQGVAILTALGISADVAAGSVAKLNQEFLDKKAAEEAEKVAKEQQQLAEEAARKFEEFRQKMISLTDTITGSLGPALKGFFDTMRNGGASLSGMVGSVLAGIAGQSAKVPGDVGTGSKVAEIIGTMVTNLGGITQAFGSSQGAATTASIAFTAAANSLENLRAVGADLTPALENMKTNSALLGAQLANLTDADLAAAGAVMDAYNALILQAEAAKDDEQALKMVLTAIAALQPEIERFATASDLIIAKRKEAILATTESLLTSFKAVMETGLVNTFDLVNQSLERVLRDKWLKALEEETKKKLAEIAKAVEDGLDPSEAVKRASIAMQGYHDALRRIEEESRRVAEAQKVLATSIEAVAIRLEQSAKEEERIRKTRRSAEQEDAVLEAARMGRIQQAAELKDATQQKYIENLPSTIQAAVKRTQELTKFTQGREANFAEIFQSIMNVTGSSLFNGTTANNLANKSGKDARDRFKILALQTANEAAARLLQDMGFSLADVEAFRTARGMSGGTGGLPGFATGGTVPGPLGQATPILAHGGEYVMTPTMVRAMESSLPRSIARELAAVMKGNNTSYIVNANYNNEQSPSDIAMDLRALVASTK